MAYALTHKPDRIIIASLANNTALDGISNRGLVQVANGDWYVFWRDNAADFHYAKSTDGRRRWTYGVEISTNIVFFDVWYDRDTPGGTGDLIHIAYYGDSLDDVIYRNLDTSSDTLAAEVTAFTGVSTAATVNSGVSIAKSRGGNLYIVYDLDGGAEAGALKSTDGGANWSNLANPNEAVGDQWLLFPGNYADTNDMDLVFWDTSANALSLKVYDDDGNSWAETAIASSMTDIGRTTTNWNLSGFVDPSNNHLMVAAWSAAASSTPSLKTWDINTSGSITATTDVITTTANLARGVVLQRCDTTIYAIYGMDETDANLLTIRYKISTDGMITWGAEKYLWDGNERRIDCLMGGQHLRYGDRLPAIVAFNQNELIFADAAEPTQAYIWTFFQEHSISPKVLI